MSMIHLNLEQGSPEWHAHRRTAFNASEAAAMLGLDKKLSRPGLLRFKATGIDQEYSDFTQRLFEEGHAAEAAFRPHADEHIGDDLYPVVGMIHLDGMPLSASFDGLTMAEDIVFEHKLFNQDLADYITVNGDLPDTHWPQVEHQMLVSGAEHALFVTSDGTTGRCAMLDYVSVPERRAKLIAGWKQFAADLAAYAHVEPVREAVAAPIETLPALFIQAEGRVINSNLAQFKAAVTAMVAGIKTELVTDQDFADADAMAKHLKEGEGKLAQAKAAALAQTASLDELFRAVDDMAALMRDKRLLLEKMVRTEKEARKTALVMAAQSELEKHIGELNATVCEGLMQPMRTSAFAEAIKGKKPLSGMQDALNAALANAKVEATQHAARIKAMLDALDAADARHLFPDIRVLVSTPIDAEPWAAMIQQRKHAEAERIAKAQAEAKARAAAEVMRKADDACVMYEDRGMAEEDAPQDAPVRATPNPPPIQRTDSDLVREFMKSRQIDDSKIRAVLIEFIRFVRASEIKSQAEARLVAALREIGHPASVREISMVTGHRGGNMHTTLSRIESIYGIPGINARGCPVMYWWLRGEPIPDTWHRDRRARE